MITLGPLTNLAVALEREPDLPRLLRGLVMMAGAYRSPGNTAPTSEWNVAVDPEAMDRVLNAWAAHPDSPASQSPLAWTSPSGRRSRPTIWPDFTRQPEIRRPTRC